MPKERPDDHRDHPYFNFDGLDYKWNRTFFHGFGNKKQRTPEDEDSDKLNYLRELRHKILGLATLSGVVLFAALFASSLAQNGGGLKNRSKEPTVLVLPQEHLKTTFLPLGVELPSTYQVREQNGVKFEATSVSNKIVNDSGASKRNSASRPFNTLYSKANKYVKYPFNLARKHVYYGSLPLEKDPSRLELADPVGWTKPVIVIVGRARRIYRVRLPAVTRRVSFNFSGICVDLLSNQHTVQDYFKKSPHVYRLFESINNSFKVGGFRTRTVSKMSTRRLESAVMSRRVKYHDLEEQERLIDRIVFILNNVFGLQAVQDGRVRPNIRIQNIPLANFFRRHILAENRVLHTQYPTQILSQTRGSYYEFSILGPLLTVSRVKEALKEDITRRLSIKVLRTCKQEMTTNLVQFEVNLNELGYDALGIIVEKMSTRSVTIRRIGPVVKKLVTIFGSLFQIRMYYQKGFQHSSSYNFNFPLEQQIVGQSEGNFIVRRVMHLPMVVNIVNPNLQQVGSRCFTHSDCCVWFNLDLNKVIECIWS